MSQLIWVILIMILLECAVDSEWNDVINYIVSCLVFELFIRRNHKNPVFNDQTSHKKYLNNRKCYNKTVCTILFSSRWWVCWYELFSVLGTLRKWKNIDETPSLYQVIIREFCQFWVILTIWDIDIIRMCSWFWVKLYN